MAPVHASQNTKIALSLRRHKSGGISSVLLRRCRRKKIAIDSAKSVSSRRDSGLLKALMDNTSIAFIDASFTVIAISEPAANMFYSTEKRLVGKDIGELFLPEYRASIGKTLADISNTDIEASAKSRSPEGVEFPVAMRCVDIRGSLNKIVGFTDPAKKRKTDRLKADFVATVSHELRTPLSSVAGALGLVQAGVTGPISDDSSAMVAIALSNTKRLIRLISDLLDIEHIESGKLHFDLKPCILNDMLQRSVDQIVPFAESHKVALIFVYDKEQSVVMADPDRLMQVFTNVISNAIKFSPPGSKIISKIDHYGPLHRISICDNGPGIPSTFRSRVFERFAQADGSDTRQVGGTGLGLAISREIVTRLDGKIWFEDNPDGGTIFHIELPSCSSRGITIA